MNTQSGIHIMTERNGPWAVAVRLSDDRITISGKDRFPNEASATLAAITYHKAKPFINYVAVRA